MNELKPLDLDTLSFFIEELLKSLAVKEVADKRILILTRILDATERRYHVEGSSIWRIEHWRKCQERQELFRKQQEEDRHKLDQRKDAFYSVLEGIYTKFNGFDSKLATKLAEEILNTGNAGAAFYFTDGKVNLASLPELPYQRYQNLDEGYTLR